MKRLGALSCVVALIAALALTVPSAAQKPQPNVSTTQRYTVQDLGTLGGKYSLASGLSENGWVEGYSTLQGDEFIHAFLWHEGVMIDLGTLGGQYSISLFYPNEKGDAAGAAEVDTKDPNGEDFCGFGTNLICLPFIWRNGLMTPLPTLGGNNGVANGINSRATVAGQAENTTPEPTCADTGQVLQYKPVLWKDGVIQELPTLPGDSAWAGLCCK